MGLYLAKSAQPPLSGMGYARRSLRCRTCYRGALGGRICTRNFRRERFAVGPNGTVLEIFLLPDRDGAFECVDQPAAGLEGRRTMRRSNHDQHAGLADLEPSQPMDDGHITNLELLQRLIGQPLHLAKCHLFVSFIIEIACLAPSRL